MLSTSDIDVEADLVDLAHRYLAGWRPDEGLEYESVDEASPQQPVEPR